MKKSALSYLFAIIMKRVQKFSCLWNPLFRYIILPRNLAFVFCATFFLKKNLPLFILFGCFFIHIANAQSECSGVYLNANDFINGKLSYACARKGKSKQTYYDLLAKNHFFIIRPDYAWRRIDKEDVFAIQGCDGEIVRIYQGVNYYLLNLGESIPIYKAVINPSSKGSAARIKYFFSKGPATEMLDLTIDNIKSTFNDDRYFIEAIATHFKDDSDLYNYNASNKCFELNNIYRSYKTNFQ